MVLNHQSLKHGFFLKIIIIIFIFCNNFYDTHSNKELSYYSKSL